MQRNINNWNKKQPQEINREDPATVHWKLLSYSAGIKMRAPQTCTGRVGNHRFTRCIHCLLLQYFTVESKMHVQDSLECIQSILCDWRGADRRPTVFSQEKKKTKAGDKRVKSASFFRLSGVSVRVEKKCRSVPCCN